VAGFVNCSATVPSQISCFPTQRNGQFVVSRGTAILFRNSSAQPSLEMQILVEPLRGFHAGSGCEFLSRGSTAGLQPAAGAVFPPLDFDVANEIESLHRAEAWQTGISVKRLVRFTGFRISLTAMKRVSALNRMRTQAGFPCRHSMAISECMLETEHSIL